MRLGSAEMALREPGRKSSIVLIDAVGLDPSPERADVTNPLELGEAVDPYAFHDFQHVGTPPSVEAAVRIRRNQQVLQDYAGKPYMDDPSLRVRLPGMPVRSLVIWGESDRIITPAYGRQFATLIRNFHFVLIPAAGHFPQIEATAAVVSIIEGFA